MNHISSNNIISNATLSKLTDSFLTFQFNHIFSKKSFDDLTTEDKRIWNSIRNTVRQNINDIANYTNNYNDLPYYYQIESQRYEHWCNHSSQEMPNELTFSKHDDKYFDYKFTEKFDDDYKIWYEKNTECSKIKYEKLKEKIMHEVSFDYNKTK